MQISLTIQTYWRMGNHPSRLHCGLVGYPRLQRCWGVRTVDFDYHLPEDLIAQAPSASRGESRLLVLERQSGSINHRQFCELGEMLLPGDVLVLNDSRVIAARLRGTNSRTQGRFELLLLEQNAVNDWWVMVKPGKRARVGTEIVLRDQGGNAVLIRASVCEVNAEGHRRVLFHGTQDIVRELDRIGEAPLPPYIVRNGAHPGDMSDRERYQTVYAKPPGSVAAPTAGLHFSKHMLADIERHGVHVCYLTLHVGLGTFAPVKSELVSGHPMHEERFEIPHATAEAVNRAKAEGRRVVAVGTTTVRVLESLAADQGGLLMPTSGRTRIFISPPYKFRCVDALLTNFHLPKSTLIMLVSAFAAPGETNGRDKVLRAYAEAIRERYRFFSYGDAMLLV